MYVRMRDGAKNKAGGSCFFAPFPYPVRHRSCEGQAWMSCRSNSVPGRVLRVALTFLLVFAVGYPGAAYGSSSRGDASSNGEGLSDSYAHDESEAAAAEREADAQDLGYVPGEIVVVYEEDASPDQIADALETVGGVEEPKTATFDTGTVATVEISEDLTVGAAAKVIEADPAVKYAVPNYLADLYDEPSAEAASQVSGLPITDYESDQWYLDYVKAPAAWEALAQNSPVASPVKVGVIDTGASLTHNDLAGIINRDESIEVVWTDSKNYDTWAGKPLRGDGYTNGGSIINEKSSHGTHVSGIIAAESGNGGVTGVASGGATSLANQLVDLVVIDAFSLYRQQSNGTWAAGAELNDIIFAMCYAAEKNCSVLNMSLGFTSSDESLKAFMEELTTELSEKNDMVIVAAAGNEGKNSPSVPALCSNVLSVASVSDITAPNISDKTISNRPWTVDNTTRSSFSNYGPWCNIAAPGEAIMSTLFYQGTQDTYGYMSGTSMACPVVAAVASMTRAANSQLSSAEVRDVLCETAWDLGKADEIGAGVVDAQAAVSRALSFRDGQTTRKDIQGASISLSRTSYTYNGSSQRPSATVSLEGKRLVEGKDYRCVYGSSSSVNVGKYTVTVRGVGDYCGNGTKQYSIVPASVSSAQVTVASQQYTGRPLTPAVTVRVGGRTLVANVDYTVSYSGNVNPGTARVTITGRGNYNGTKSATFSIAAARPPAPVAGWSSSGGITRYLYAGGGYAQGWLYVDGVWYYFDSAGAMQTGWVYVDGAWYYLMGDGSMATGWLDLNGIWYYLNGSGAMHTGWLDLWGTWYYLDESGAMLTDWVNVGGVWYYLYGSGAMAANTWVGNYYVYGSGAMAKSTWIGRYHVNRSGLWDRTR